MKRTVEKVFFALIRFEVNKTEIGDDIKKLITPEILPALFILAKKHDLAHLVGEALHKNGFLVNEPDLKKKFLHERNMAVYRMEQLRYESERLFSALEELQVEYLPLKGTVLREFYSDDWCRTSADIDVLIHKDDLEKILPAVKDKLSYTQESIGPYDVVVVSPWGIHVELHFDLIAKYDNAKANKLLSNVWSRTERINQSYRRLMRDDDFYYYHLAHMARHFIDGGCGVRPYIDLWLLNNKCDYDRSARDAILEKGDLLKFAQASTLLADIWMENKTHTSESLMLEEYILNGGVYGNSDNKVVIRQGKTGSRSKYIASRIFMPLEEMQYRYQVLKRHKWMYPFMVIRRCFEVFFKGDSKRIRDELKTSETISPEMQTRFIHLVDYLGLKNI